MTGFTRTAFINNIILCNPLDAKYRRLGHVEGCERQREKAENQQTQILRSRGSDFSTGVLAPKSFGFSPTALVRGQQQGVPTLDDLSTGWLDCSQLAHMPSLHNFHEMGACAPDLVGVNFLPGGQLYKTLDRVGTSITPFHFAR